MTTRRLGNTAIGLLWTVLSLTGLACDERPETKVKAPASTEATEPEPAPTPAPPTPPTFGIDEIGPKVRFSRSVVSDESGAPRNQGLEQLRRDLAEEAEFVRGKTVLLTVSRQAKVPWVALYLSELASLEPQGITIQTETRAEFPKEVPFVSEAEAKQAPPCSLVGAITEDRGTAIWTVAGGTARKRGRGMGGPDLTMTGDTIVSLAKKCDSDLFVVSGAPGVEWGLLYDLAASAIALEKAELKRALLPQLRPTPGRPLEWAR